MGFGFGGSSQIAGILREKNRFCYVVLCQFWVSADGSRLWDLEANFMGKLAFVFGVLC